MVYFGKFVLCIIIDPIACTPLPNICLMLPSNLSLHLSLNIYVCHYLSLKISFSTLPLFLTSPSISPSISLSHALSLTHSLTHSLTPHPISSLCYPSRTHTLSNIVTLH